LGGSRLGGVRGPVCGGRGHLICGLCVVRRYADEPLSPLKCQRRIDDDLNYRAKANKRWATVG